jgi:hypothetical protein
LPILGIAIGVDASALGVYEKNGDGFVDFRWCRALVSALSATCADDTGKDIASTTVANADKIGSAVIGGGS